jgi:hypothetical protein
MGPRSLRWPLSSSARPSQVARMRPLTAPSAKFSVNARLRDQHARRVHETKLRGRNASTLISARLVSARIRLAAGAARADLDWEQRPSTSPDGSLRAPPRQYGGDGDRKRNRPSTSPGRSLRRRPDAERDADQDANRDRPSTSPDGSLLVPLGHQTEQTSVFQHQRRGSGNISGRQRHLLRSRSTSRPKTSPYFSHSTLPHQWEPLQHRSRAPKGTWRLCQRLSPLPGFQQPREQPHKPKPSTSSPTPTPATTAYIHVKLKYTRWMQKARDDLARRPGFVADDRALIDDPARRDAVMIRTAAPRAGQPFEAEVHHAARHIQRGWRTFWSRLRKWSAILIQCAWRQHHARQTLQFYRATRARQQASIHKMRLMRCRTRLLLWHAVAAREAAIKDVGRRFLDSSDGERLNFAFGRWWDVWDAVCKKNDHTVMCFHRWRTHKLRCRALYTWVNQWLLAKALRNFIANRCFRRWRRNAIAIRSARVFNVETQAAFAIQLAYRAMRERDLALMEAMGAQEDVVAFKARRQRSSVCIQCCARIWAARRRYDARCCARFVMRSVLLGNRLARGMAASDEKRARARAERAERIRQADERDFVLCELRREDADGGIRTRMRPTFFDARQCWRRRGGSWVRKTEEGRSALRRLKQRRRRRLDEARKRVFDLDYDTTAAALSLRDEVEAERLVMRMAAARGAFRARWPPPFVCSQCHRGFALPRAMCCGLEIRASL